MTGASFATCRRTSDAVPVAAAILIFSALSLWAGLVSEGFLEADACTHYMYSRFAFAEPYRFVDVWGRPVCTALYAPGAALFGKDGAGVTSLFVAVGIALIAYRLARRQGYTMPALAAVFTLAQPLVFTHSFSVLTELPFALILALAFWAYRARRWAVMTILVGLTPLSRPEGFGFLGLAAIGLVLHRRATWLPLLLVPLAAWNHAGWELFGRQEAWWRWLPDHWPYSADSLYDRGHLLHFAALLPAVTSPFVFPAMLVGIGICVGKGRPLVDRFLLSRARQGPGRGALSHPGPDGPGSRVADRGEADDVHRIWCDVLIAAVPLMILVGHSVLYFLGKMASNGELRYLLIVAPFWGLLACRGWAWLSRWFVVRRPYAWATAACLLPVLANVAYPVIPIQLDDSWQAARVAARWAAAAAGGGGHTHLTASHPGVYYFLDVSPTDGTRTKEWNIATVRAAPPGVLAVWDSMYAMYNADGVRRVTEQDFLDAGWTRDEGAARELATPPAPAGSAAGWDEAFRTPSSYWCVFRSPQSVP